MATESKQFDLGLVTAYAYAVSKGYTGTEEEFATLMASYATVAEAAAAAAAQAARQAQRQNLQRSTDRREPAGQVRTRPRHHRTDHDQ